MIGYSINPRCKTELGNLQVRNSTKPFRFKYVIPSSQTLSIRLAGMVGTIDWGDGTTKSITATNTTHSKTYTSAGQYIIELIGDINTLTYINIANNTGNNYLYGDISCLKNAVNITTYDVRAPKICGNILDLANLTKLQSFAPFLSGAIGDIYAMRNMSDLRTFWGAYGLTGDISVLASLPLLTTIGIDTAALYGNISCFSGKNNITYFGMNNFGRNRIVGDINALSNCVNITTLSNFASGIYGDLSFLTNFTKLTYINHNGLNHSFETSNALPAYGGEFYFLNTQWASSEHLDRFINALAVNAKNTGNRKFHSNGTGTPRTSASDDAVAYLQSIGWQVITNKI